MRILKKTYIGIVFFFLYAPILVLMILSFNEGKSRANFKGFTFDWYIKMFQDTEIMKALVTTIELAVISAVIATVFGTVAAIGIHSMRKYPKALTLNMTYLPVSSSDMVTGISLLMLFVFIKLNMGFTTLLIAHVTFNTPYVILAVLPKLSQSNKSLYEAALDLGASPLKAYWKVVVPEIKPGIITGFIMAITLSIDDFVISYFVGGNGVETLPMKIYTMTKRGVSPEINALSTLLFVVIFALLLIVNKRSSHSDAERGK